MRQVSDRCQAAVNPPAARRWPETQAPEAGNCPQAKAFFECILTLWPSTALPRPSGSAPVACLVEKRGENASRPTKVLRFTTETRESPITSISYGAFICEIFPSLPSQRYCVDIFWVSKQVQHPCRTACAEAGLSFAAPSGRCARLLESSVAWLPAVYG